MNSIIFSAPVAAPSVQNGGPSGSHPSQPVQKRNRTQLSCTSCRQSKLKCDRKKPCSQCTKKGISLQCTFPSPAIRKKPAVSMVDRVKHLESLVKDAMQSQPPASIQSISSRSEGSADGLYASQESTPPEALSQDQVVFGEEQSTYVGATHWAAILENIEEVKSYFEEPRLLDEEDVRPYTSLIFNAQSTTTHHDLITALPPRLTVDRLVSRYFNSNSPALPIIHKPAFQNEYRKFWEHPESTPVSWLGLLYSILILATLTTLNAGDNPPSSPGDSIRSVHRYRECCVQSLHLSKYTKPGPYTLEALLIYMESEFLFSANDPVHCYLLIGNTFRLAFRMGLHRDSSKIRSPITTFQAEMRRRVWHHLLQIDVLASFHIGLPGNIQGIESDTQLPHHLRDEDFDTNTAELPPPRPETELTPLLYTICKGRLCHEAAKVAAMANRLTVAPYSEIQHLDSLLTQAHKAVSPFFLLKGSEIPITDPPDRTIKRFSIGLLFQKSRCMLHRKYSQPESRQIALSASLELLKYQRMVHQAASPGGPLAQDRWFLSSISMHDFLLAAMIVYLRIREQEGVKGEMIDVIEKSFAIWSDTESWSNPLEAKRAAAVVGGMLNKVHELNQASGQRYDGSATHSISLLSLEGNSMNHSLTTSTNAFTDSRAESTPSSGMGMPYDSVFEQPFGDFMEFSNDFDWEIFDSQLRPQNTWPELPGGLDFDSYNFNADL